MPRSWQTDIIPANRASPAHVIRPLDKVGGKPVENKKCVIDKISNLINLYSMHDVWREKNPNEKQFTWREKAFKVRWRLDYFLVSQNLVNLTKDCHITHAPGSDHCAVKVFIQSGSLNKKAGPGFWKFNWFIAELKENIKIYRNKYQCVEVRGFTIAHAKRKAKNKRTNDETEN